MFDIEWLKRIYVELEVDQMNSPGIFFDCLEIDILGRELTDAEKNWILKNLPFGEDN